MPELTPEQKAREQIDAMLTASGWAVQNYRAFNPSAAPGVALREVPVHLLPNVVVALDRYLVTYCCDDGVCPNPMHARGVAIQATAKPADAILRFYLLLGRALEVIRTSSLPYWEYLSKYNSIPAKVLHSSVETPPPHLGKWTEGN